MQRDGPSVRIFGIDLPAHPRFQDRLGRSVSRQIPGDQPNEDGVKANHFEPLRLAYSDSGYGLGLKRPTVNPRLVMGLNSERSLFVNEVLRRFLGLGWTAASTVLASCL